MVVNNFCFQDSLNLHRHDLAVAHRGAGLVCYSVTYLEYKSACPAAYAIPLSHISDIRESVRNFLESDRELYFKCPINIHGKLDAPSLIKYKVTSGGVIGICGENNSFIFIASH